MKKVYCKDCKHVHSIYWNSGPPYDVSGFDHYECWHPIFKKEIVIHNYSGNDKDYIKTIAPRSDKRNKNGDCKDYELYIPWWKFWIKN